jgi:two-component system response regulator LytT
LNNNHQLLINLINWIGKLVEEGKKMNYKAKILLVDDEPKVINALKRVLNSEDYELLSTTSAEEAMQILRNSNLDMIICDQCMPNILGIDILKYSKKLLPDAIRILITGFSDINVAISAINEGSIFYYFSKPWNNEEINQVVKRGLDLVKKRKEKKGQLELMEYSRENLEEVTGKLKSLNELLKSIKKEPFQNAAKEQDLKKISVCKDDHIILINTTDILYLAATDGDVIITTKDGNYKSPNPLNFWEKKLDENSFFRCHRSYIVNIDKIERITPWFNGAYNLKLKDLKENIPVSRNSTKKLKELFGL